MVESLPSEPMGVASVPSSEENHQIGFVILLYLLFLIVYESFHYQFQISIFLQHHTHLGGIFATFPMAASFLVL